MALDDGDDDDDDDDDDVWEEWMWLYSGHASDKSTRTSPSGMASLRSSISQQPRKTK